jgi:hypothetical protein
MISPEIKPLMSRGAKGGPLTFRLGVQEVFNIGQFCSKKNFLKPKLKNLQKFLSAFLILLESSWDFLEMIS